MKALFILMFLANVAVTLVSLVLLPDRVAIHFGLRGVADGWASRSVHALLMTGTHVLLFLFMLIVGLLVLEANLAETVKLDLPVFLGAFVAFLLYTVWWTIAFCCAFRIPAGDRNGPNRPAAGPGAEPE